jgi:shikimate kinase
MSIVLIGYRGSGKTTVGRRLADRLWWKFLDLDERIVATAGKSIAQLFADEGEAHFRDLETAALSQSMTLSDHVISAGGGALGREENRAALRRSGHKVIYLRCEADVLHQRVTSDPATAQSRPDLTGAGGLAEIVSMLKLREPIYREAMHAELDVTNLTPSEACVRIVKLL